MIALTMPLRALFEVNSRLLAIGRWIAGVLIGLMTAVILYQVLMRYAFNAAPTWSEEAARFMMLWMTGLIAPSGYRWGGFVAIDTVVRVLPRVAATLLSLFLLVLAFTVLVIGLSIGIDEVTGFAGSFKTAALYYPVFGAEGLEFEKMPRSWMMLSLVMGVALMISVNVELILRTLIEFLSPETKTPVDTAAFSAGAD